MESSAGSEERRCPPRGQSLVATDTGQAPSHPGWRSPGLVPSMFKLDNALAQPLPQPRACQRPVLGTACQPPGHEVCLAGEMDLIDLEVDAEKPNPTKLLVTMDPHLE